MKLYKEKSQEEKLAKVKNKLAKGATGMGEAWDYKLDFSEKSMKSVSRILQFHHQELKRTGDDYGLNGIALSLGFYIMKVFEKEFGSGDLKQHHEVGGKDTFPFTLQGITIFPYGWCLKQLSTGKREDVETKYRAFKSKIEQNIKEKSWKFYNNSGVKMADGKDRMEQVLNYGMDMAKKLLTKNGEFHSILMYLDKDGKGIIDSGEVDSEFPDADALIDQLEGIAFAKAEKKEITTAALISDIKMTDRDTGKKRDAIAIRLDDIGADALVVFYPYTRNFLHKLTVENQPTVQKDSRPLFG